jgi:outer membrane protein assembly factor BamB
MTAARTLGAGRRPPVLVLALVGCSNFGTPGPATFHEPAAQLARALAPVAARPRLRAPTPAESLDDVRVLGDRALLDLRGESGNDGSFSALATCGPLELRSIADNQLIWSIAREPGCKDQIVATAPQLAIVGQRATTAGPPARVLLTYALATGARTGSVALDATAWLAPVDTDLAVVAGAAGKQTVTLRDPQLAVRWTTAIADRGALARLIARPRTLLVFGQAVTVLDRQTGAATASTPLGDGATVLDAVVTPEGSYAQLALRDGLAVARVTDAGRVVWTRPVAGLIDAAAPGQVITVADAEVTALKVGDGSVAWTARLPGKATGTGAIAKGTWLVPHEQGVSGYDVATGALRFTVQPLPPSAADVHADRLSVADDVVVLDTGRGVAGLDPDGRVRYAIAVRSLAFAQRDARLRASGAIYDVAALRAHGQRDAAAQASYAQALNNLGTTMGGGLAIGTLQMQQAGAAFAAARAAANFAALAESLNARRGQHAAIALTQARLDAAAPYVVRPISWASGRGVLVIRKRDGAFQELVTGPPDVYEDRFRPASVAAVVPDARTVLTFAEGVEPARWVIGPIRQPTQLIARRVLGYGLDDAQLIPAAEYARRSVVPAGAFEASD